MTGDDKSSGTGGLFDDDDPFDISVKVTLPDVQTQSQTSDGKDPKETKDDKDEDRDDKKRDKSDDEDRNQDAENSGVGGEQDEDEDGGSGNRNLRASRRHAKRLSRQLGRNAIYVTQLEARVGQMEKMNVNLLKSQMSAQIGAKRSDLARLRSDRMAARTANDAATENAAEDAIGSTTAEIAKLEQGLKELEDYKPPQAQNPMLSDWMERNSDWYEKPGYERETQAAKQASIDAARQGQHQYDPRHFASINDAVSKINKRLMDGEEADGVANEEDQQDTKRGQSQKRDVRRGPAVAGGGRRVPGGGGQRGSAPQVPKALLDAWKQAGFSVTTKEEQQEVYDRYMETQSKLGLLEKVRSK